MESSSEVRTDIAKHSIYLKPARLTIMHKNREHAASSMFAKGPMKAMRDVGDYDDDQTEMGRGSMASGTTMGRPSIALNNGYNDDEEDDTDLFLRNVGRDQSD